MTAKKFGRIVNITSGTVKLPQAGLDLSSAARGGLTIFLAGVARQVAAEQRDDQQSPARRVRDRSAEGRARPRSPSAGALATTRRWPSASPAFRRSGWATSKASARPARSCARRRRASSPGRISRSTAGRFRARSEIRSSHANTYRANQRPPANEAGGHNLEDRQLRSVLGHDRSCRIRVCVEVHVDAQHDHLDVAVATANIVVTDWAS